jgi:hypothetical protein
MSPGLRWASPLVCLARLQKDNIRLFLGQQTDNRQTSTLVNGLRKITWASIFGFQFDFYHNVSEFPKILIPCLHVHVYMSMSPCPYLHVSGSMSPCLHVSPCLLVSMSMSPCLHVSMSPCLHVSMSPCLHVSMSLCLYVSIFIYPCFRIRGSKN